MSNIILLFISIKKWVIQKFLVDFDVLTYNIRGLGDERKRRKVFNYIKRTRQENLFFSNRLTAPIKLRIFGTTSGMMTWYSVMERQVVEESMWPFDMT